VFRKSPVRRRFEHAIIGHEGHQGFDIVSIPRIRESLQHFWRHFDERCRHECPPFDYIVLTTATN
jgi:hypothetical protein